MNPVTRRSFMCALGGGLVAWGVRRKRDDGPQAGDAAAHWAERASWALGAEVSITAAHAEVRRAEAAIDAAFAELERIEEVMSIYRPHSELRRLNAEGQLEAADPRLLELLETAAEVSRLSAGAFDITVQPLWEAYARARSLGTLPSDDELLDLRRVVDYRRVELNGRRVRLRGGGAVTLNGIAQGYALDRVQKVLREHGVTDALIDTGELAGMGRRDWQAGIQHPRREDALAAVASLRGRCLATSGDYATIFSEDRRHHHLLRPDSGRSPQELASVSVVAPSGVLADALSTAVFVMGPRRGARLIQSLPDCEALLVTKDQRQLRTPGFPLALTDPPQAAGGRS